MMRRYLWPCFGAPLSVLLVLVSGCAGKTEMTAEPVALSLKAFQDQYRPGQAVIVEVELENRSSETVTVRQLNADSVAFWWSSPEDKSPLIRRAISSPREDLEAAMELPSQSQTSRRFVLVDVTPEQGTFFLQGYYTSPTEKRNEGVTAISEPFQYVVEGELQFARGDDGLISPEDAIAVAKEYLGRPALDGNAALVRNEAGFYDYWVTIEVAPDALAKNERPLKGYFVNPYLGEVRKEAQPRPPQETKRPPVEVEPLRNRRPSNTE